MFDPTAVAHKGIVAGMPVLVSLDTEQGTWIVPANRFVYVPLMLYMRSWFYNDDSPVFVYEGSYWDGLFAWIFMAKDSEEL